MASGALAGSDDTEINLTPLLDIVFIMLIFFIVTATFVREAGLDISKPPSLRKPNNNKVSILISIDQDSQIWFGDQAVDVRRVRANIEKLLAQ